ncbi:MAG: hypothetical protein ACR2MM_12190 [Flavobacteriaceae bacterium]
MKYRILITGLVLSLFILSCKEKKKSGEVDSTTSKMEEVMAIHDEVMPKMSTIGKLVADLKPKVDTTATGIEYKKAMNELQDAHKSMMDWMQGFGKRFDSDEILNGKALSAQKKEWLMEEEEKVKAMRDQVNSSIENAERLLQNPD